MIPQDFDSFASGFNLTSGNYSGGAGGTFANMLSAGEDWAVDGGTPTFATKGGIEGVVFSSLATESILGQHRATWECTIITIIEAPAAGSVFYSSYGGSWATRKTFGQEVLNFQCRALAAPLATVQSGWTTAASPNNVPHVLTTTFSPSNGTVYAQIDTGTIVSNTPISGAYSDASINYANAAIGRQYTSYLTGWVGRALVFDRALHFRDNDRLQVLIASEMALVGL